LGCSVEDYSTYLEERMTDGMTWDNHGEWHIDHIVAILHRVGNDVKPTPEELLARLHYTNTQPLWREENLKKGNR
jgi:hypothetical protein